MEDQQIVALYTQRSDEAIVQTQKKYGKLCMSIAMRILRSREDSEECVNDAYHRIWNAIPPAQPKSLAAFAGRIVRNLSLDRYKYNRAGRRNEMLELSFQELEACLPAGTEPEAGELTELIEAFLRTQNRQARVLFVLRYWAGYDTAELAERLHMSEGGVRASLSRTRGRLKEYLLKEGILV